MGFKCGIVGLPNVGKSTLFNALTAAAVEASNYPFCTIEPNVGVVPVPDIRLKKIAEIVRPKQVIPTTVEFVDIAGLVAGASQGEGLGNKFLAHIRETQAIAHVVRCFTSGDIAHVTGEVNPQRDIETINTELTLADLETVGRALNKTAKNAKSGNKELVAEKILLEKMNKHLDAGQPIRTFINDDNAEFIAQLHLLTAKPVLYIANVDESGLVDNALVQQVEKIAASENAVVVPICASIESEIAQLGEDEKTEFLVDLGLAETGLDRLIRSGYELLGLQTYFTAGPKEARAWTFPDGALAPQAAGIIHTDFEHGFIRAEVISYEDFIKYGGEHGAKEAGRLRLEGKNYRVQNGDIMHFRFNV